MHLVFAKELLNLEVGVHQRSALDLFVFVTIMDRQTEKNSTHNNIVAGNVCE